MAYEHETFKNAPITEALADFLVSFDKPPLMEDLGRYSDYAKDRFPTRRERTAYSTSIAVEGEEPVFTNTQSRFLAYSSEDKKEVAQVRTDGFSFSRLRPYIKWDDFVIKTDEALTYYLNCFKPRNINGVSLKYVNRITVPGDTVNFAAYFKTGIQVADGLPTTMSDAFYRFTLTFGPDRAIVMFATDLIEKTKDAIPMVFDIEVIRRQEVALDRDSVRKTLNELRDLKNLIFFNSLTDKTKEMFR